MITDIKITLNTENDAFIDNRAEIIRVLLESIETFRTDGCGSLLRDTNGNTVGHFTITRDIS